MYADVVVDIAVNKLDRTFQYRIPDGLFGQVAEGSKVIVPFGKKNRLTDGYVLSLSLEPKCDENIIKNIDSAPKEYVTAEEKLLLLASWIRRTYGSTYVQALKTVLPLKEKNGKKSIKIIYPAVSPEEHDALAKEWERKRFFARARLFTEIAQSGSVLWGKAVKELRIPRDTLASLEKKGLIRIKTAVPESKSDDKPKPLKKIAALSAEQMTVYDGIKQEFAKTSPRPCLIRGVTGSGKTHIYMKLIEDTFREGHQAVLLIPEISLTWQTVSRFYECFGSKAAVLHSRLSKKERAELTERIERGVVELVIGPRSALFAPFNSLGLIIIDEEHDSSYQSDKTPRYHARETACERARIENANLLLGSATPSLESRYRCDRGEYVLFELKKRYSKAVLPEIKIVDMRSGQKSAGVIFSPELLCEIEQRQKKKEQSMLFLNKRGHTGLFTCRSCGTVFKCPHCDVALTYHNNGLLMCHYCGYTRPMTDHCPVCSSPYIGGYRVGTQQVEEALKKSFPSARVVRMDRDSTSAKDGHEKILKAFAEGGADILVGTQMIVKGHDFPNVTLVGIISADLSLYAGDFRAGERTYQLLVQAVGRAGRSSKKGIGIIQTYSPDHYVIRCAANQDYEAFYREEIFARKVMHYPPAGVLLSVHGSARGKDRLSNAMSHIKIYLERIKSKDTEAVLGPVNEAVSKIRDLNRMVIYVKCVNTRESVRLRQYTEKYIEINSGFADINIQFAAEN